MLEALKTDPISTIIVTLLALSIPFGLFMGLYTENGWWYLFCIPIFIFLS